MAVRYPVLFESTDSPVLDPALLVPAGSYYTLAPQAPDAHAATHGSAGSDPLTLAQSQVTNLTSDLGTITTALASKEPAFTTLPTSKGGTGQGTAQGQGRLWFGDSSGNLTTLANLSVVQANGHVMVGTSTDYTSYGGAMMQVRESGAANTRWYGRLVAGGDAATFLLGQYNDPSGNKRAWLGAHNGALTAWADIWINPQNGSGTKVAIGCTSAGVGNTILTVDNTTESVKVGPSGTNITQVKVYTPTLTPAAIGAAGLSVQTFAVAGLATTDTITCNGPSAAASTALVHWRVSAVDTVELTWRAEAAATPTSGTYRILAFRS